MTNLKRFDVLWSVTKFINGPGQHDGGVKDGDREVVASGQIVKESESAEAVKAGLTEVLELNFPHHMYGPTHDIEHLYNIEVKESK